MNAEMEKRTRNLLSMAARARRILSGAFVVEEALKRKQGTNLLLAADASEETKTKFTRMAAQQNVPTAELLTMQQLGHCLGKEGQNARLAAKLTGWKIDIKSESQARELMAEDAAEDSALNEPLAGEA